MSDNWVYPETPRPTAEADEWLAWSDCHIEHLEQENDELRAELTEMFDKILDLLIGNPVDLRLPWTMDADKWRGVYGTIEEA